MKSFQNLVHFVSLGCPRNLVDSEVMIGHLIEAGYQMTAQLKEADVLIVNTCGFLESARLEAVQVIERLCHSKKNSAKMIVTGCMVRHNIDTLKKRFPDIHFFLGSGDGRQILQAVQSKERGEIISQEKSFLECSQTPRILSTPPHYAYLKIAEGCQKRCSYCIIPDIKGPLKSKTIEQVLHEFHALLDRGVFEVILVAQDLGDFGKDRAEKRALSALLRSLLQDKRPFWLRLLYLYPDEIDEELISVIKSDPRICPYLDIPIQHINDEILHSMRRKTSSSEILNVIDTLRAEIPEIAIRTSILVGYPGETEEQFQELVRFVQSAQLDQVGIFQFSPEKDSPAASMSNQISKKEKERRYQILAAAQQEMIKQKMRSFIGRRVMALIDGVHPESDLLLSARTNRQCPEVDSQIIINDAPAGIEAGKLYPVEITDCTDVDWIGRIV